jgi:hypothetical protein
MMERFATTLVIAALIVGAWALGGIFVGIGIRAAQWVLSL